MMKCTFSLALLVLIAAVTTLAQTPRRSQSPPRSSRPAAAIKGEPTVNVILSNFVKAIGGEAAVRKQHSRTSTGTVEITAMGAKGDVEISQKAPNKMSLVMNLAGLGAIREGFDGTTAWSQDPFTGLREKGGAELAATKRDASFYRDVELAKGYSSMALKSTEKVGGRDAYIIEATPPEGTTPDKLYFDKETFLLVRFDSLRESPQGTIPVQAYLEDYRAVDGIKMPFVMRQAVAGTDIIIRLTNVRHDAPIDEAKFSKPAAK
ncbi:MAG TPA: hypothetical protein VM866_05925 [Pyrinomonadaceae bacterium]|nr:hypothetical protein [Pyrinomonadaceae bacterium]